MVDRNIAGEGEGGEPARRADLSVTYEPPRLVPVGSLHDLLAGGGSQCDVDQSTGTGAPVGSC
jgi:hypothetical protein